MRRERGMGRERGRRGRCRGGGVVGLRRRKRWWVVGEGMEGGRMGDWCVYTGRVDRVRIR